MIRTPMIAVLTALLGVAGTSRGETGMGLALEVTNTGDRTGKARRIDLKNGRVVNTSVGFGKAIRKGRISPDGTRVITINRNKVVEIWDLVGRLKRSFTTFVGYDGHVSWTRNTEGRESLWVGGVGKLVRYNTSGVEQEALTLVGGGSGPTLVSDAHAALTKVSTVSFDERTAGGYPGFAVVVLLDTKNSNNEVEVIRIGNGCSVGPSPDGQLLTQNRWDEGVEHQTMAIHDRLGARTERVYLYDIMYGDTSAANRTWGTRGYSWNWQSWSSNSNDVVLIPAGRCYPNMSADNPACSTMPWIYNMNTKKAFCLYDANGDGTSDCRVRGTYWYIFDYHRGRISSDVACGDLSDCNDDEACTDDVCSGGRCVHTPIADCCDDPGGCDDRCDSTVSADCCEGPADCFDGDDCTEDLCNASHRCENPGIDQCAPRPSVDMESPQVGAVWQPGTTASIEWSTSLINDVVIYLSTDGGENWQSIGRTDSAAPDWGAFQYPVPSDVASADCVVMVEDYLQQGAAKSGVFAIGQGSARSDATSREDGRRDAGSLGGGCSFVAAGSAADGIWWLLGLVFTWPFRRRADPGRRGPKGGELVRGPRVYGR